MITNMSFKITILLIAFIANLYLTSAQSECDVYDFEDGVLGTSEMCAVSGDWLLGSYADIDIAPPSPRSSNYITTGDSMFSCIASETIDMVENGVVQIQYYAEGSVYIGVMGMEGSDAFINEALNVNVGAWTIVTFIIPRDLSGQIHITGSPTSDNSRLLIDSFGYANSEDNIEYCFSGNITTVTPSTTAATQSTTAVTEQLTTITTASIPEEITTLLTTVNVGETSTPLTTTNVEEVTTPSTTINLEVTTPTATTPNAEEVTTPSTTVNMEQVTIPTITTNEGESTTPSTTVNVAEVTTPSTTVNMEQVTIPTITTNEGESTTPSTTVNIAEVTTPSTTVNMEQVTIPTITTTEGESTTPFTTVNVAEVTTPSTTTNAEEVTTPSTTVNIEEFTTPSTTPNVEDIDTPDTIAPAEYRFWNAITITGAVVTIVITMFTVSVCAYEIGQRRAKNNFNKLQASEYGASVSSVPTHLPRVKLQYSKDSLQRTQSYYDYY